MMLEERWCFEDGPLAGLEIVARLVEDSGRLAMQVYCVGPALGEPDALGDIPQWWAVYRGVERRHEDAVLRLDRSDGWDESTEPLLRRPQLAD